MTTATRGARSVPHYGYSRDRAPAPSELAPRDHTAFYRPSIQLTWRCSNVFCRNWTMNGSYLTGRCNFCFTPRG